MLNKKTLFLDNRKNGLVFVGTTATAGFWDQHWHETDIKSTRSSKNRFVNHWTEPYLPKGSFILEGGCGCGQNVLSLILEGFDVYGVDYAVDTVQEINRFMPNLKVLPADVRHLPFPEGFFDGLNSSNDTAYTTSVAGYLFHKTCGCSRFSLWAIGFSQKGGSAKFFHVVRVNT